MPQVTTARHGMDAMPQADPHHHHHHHSDELYTPKIKKVLKSYQAAATTSLMGPMNYQSSWSSPSPPSSSAKSGSSSTTSSSSCSSQPATKVPVMIKSDESCFWSETLLSGELISCFVIGGEMRLCLPQVLNSVLKNSIEEINSACTELQIFCSRCTPDQLAVLKRKGILPVEASSCGLITKTDAERLVAALVDRNPPQLSDLRKEPDQAIDKMLSVAVFHDCFGKTRGLYRPDLYTNPLSACIQCCECAALFPPQKFVSHSHQPRTRTCLWGFDSLNWRSYLLLAKDQSRANNCASENKSQVTGCCADHRPAGSLSPDSQQHQKELDRVMDQMRKRFDLHPYHQFARHHAAVAKLNPPSADPPAAASAKRKEKEISESANRDEEQSSPSKRLKPQDAAADMPASLSSVPSFLPPHHMFYPNLLPIWSSYHPSHMATHPSLPELFQLSYHNQSSPHSSLSTAASAIPPPPISRHDQHAAAQQLLSESEPVREQVHRVLHKLTTLLVNLPHNEVDEVCSDVRLALDRIQGPQKEVRRHSASLQRLTSHQYR